jgi:NAD+ synthase
MPAYAEGAVLGMSGGIDSSVVAALTASAFRSYRVCNLTLRGYALPTKLNSLDDVKDAQRVAELYKIQFEAVDLDPAVQGMDTLFALGMSPYSHGNMISRLRANVLWTLAAHHKSIVMGTGNKDEDYGVGYYTLLGDGAVHMNPIGFLSKRLVRELGAQLGLPEDLVKRIPTAGLEPGQTDAKDLGYPYEFVELVIEGIDQGFSMWDLVRHPQIVEFDSILTVNSMSVMRSPSADRVQAVFDVLHRHDIAKHKAAYICPKVPDIKLPLALRLSKAAHE